MPSNTTTTTTCSAGHDTTVCRFLWERWQIGHGSLQRLRANTGGMATHTIAGIEIPDSPLVRDVTAYIRDVESDLLFDHSRRVFLFGALQGQRLGLEPDLELLYVGAMFHDIGLTQRYRRIDSALRGRRRQRRAGLPAGTGSRRAHRSQGMAEYCPAHNTGDPGVPRPRDRTCHCGRRDRRARHRRVTHCLKTRLPR